MRGKASEGIEFRDKNNENLFSSLVLAGLPYPNISDDLVRKRIENLSTLLGMSTNAVMDLLTEITIRQTIGRALRNEHDYVKIYLCDERYKRYLNSLGIKENEIKLYSQ